MKLNRLPLIACVFLFFFHCASSHRIKPSLKTLGGNDVGSPSYAPVDHQELKTFARRYIPSNYTVLTKDNPWPGFLMAYKFHPTKKTWNEARRTCHQEGAYLAYADSVQERQRYHNILRHQNSGGAWMGMHDLFEEGDWVTVLDESVNELEREIINWAHLEPNNYGETGENCAELQMDGRLYDMTCDKHLFFFCKMYVNY